MRLGLGEEGRVVSSHDEPDEPDERQQSAPAASLRDVPCAGGAACHAGAHTQHAHSRGTDHPHRQPALRPGGPARRLCATVVAWAQDGLAGSRLCASERRPPVQPCSRTSGPLVQTDARLTREVLEDELLHAARAALARRGGCHCCCCWGCCCSACSTRLQRAAAHQHTRPAQARRLHATCVLAPTSTCQIAQARTDCRRKNGWIAQAKMREDGRGG